MLTLHNLELDLAPVLGGAAELADVRRAFARRLSITIPWTALTSQPIQVHLDPVELVLAAAAAPAPASAAAEAAAAAAAAATAQEGGGEPDDAESAVEAEAAAASPAAPPGGGGGGAGPGWFGGALQSLALRAGLNVSVKLTNVVAKWVHDAGVGGGGLQQQQCVASVTFQELGLQTSTDDWREGLQVGGRGGGRVPDCEGGGIAGCRPSCPPERSNPPPWTPSAAARSASSFHLPTEPGGLAEEGVLPAPAQH